MCIAIEGPQLIEVNFHQILDLVVNIIYLFHEILGERGESQGAPTSVWNPDYYTKLSLNPLVIWNALYNISGLLYHCSY